jgi:predicted AAA+ superfamily ATPase
MIPIEVKYQDQIARTDLFAMADFRKVTRTKGGIMLSKGTLEGRDGYSIVPVSTFLLLV